MTDRVEGTASHVVDIHLTGAKGRRLTADTIRVARGVLVLILQHRSSWSREILRQPVILMLVFVLFFLSFLVALLAVALIGEKILHGFCDLRDLVREVNLSSSYKLSRLGMLAGGFHQPCRTGKRLDVVSCVVASLRVLKELSHARDAVACWNFSCHEFIPDVC